VSAPTIVTPTQPEIWLPRLGCNPPEHKFNRQWRIFNTRKRIVLVSGSRKSGKTWACLHRVIRHLWETPGARVGVFAKSKGLAKEGGSWQDLVERTIPEWTEGGICTAQGDPFSMTTLDIDGNPGVKQDSSTRSSYFKVRNLHGGESECRLFSIHDENDIAGQIKNKSFSMIYIIELSMFKDPRILSITLPSLRMAHLKPARQDEDDIFHQWIADTNPDEDLGDQSWFYNTFYTERLKKRDETDPKQRRLQKYYDSMEVIEMFTADNPFVTEQERIELEGSCEGDPALYDSYVLGVHGQAGRKRDRHFAPYFNKSTHVVGGDTDGGGDQIDVHPTTVKLYGGWDIGSSTNHAAVFLDKRPIQTVDPRDPDKKRIIELSYWSVLDEVVSIDERIGLDELTREAMEKIRELEMKSARKFDWQHWSDDSAINVWRSSSSSFDYLEVQAHSNGEIFLNGVDKPDGSVKARVRVLQMLLKTGRIWISSRCVKTIAMLEGCQKGAKENEYVKWNEHKHVFDALTYPIYMETRSELFDQASGRPNASQYSSVPIVAAG
jgi:hypothetical protein